MTSSGGYQVAPSGLTDFESYLNNTTVADIKTAAQGVSNANGGDVNSFGVALGQVLGIPARIAMGIASSNLNSLAQTISGVADNVGKTADQYHQNEQHVSTSFQNVHGV